MVSIAIAIDYAILYALAFLTNLNLIDWRTVLSFLIAEMLLALLLKLFGFGEESEEAKRYRELRMAITKAKLSSKFGHLEIHYVKDRKELLYPNESRFVVNTKTSKAYWIPKYLTTLDNEEIINDVEHKSETILKEHMKENKITSFNRYPKGDELSLTTD